MTQFATLDQAEQYIAARAAGLGLDPGAVLSVASQEGLSAGGWAGPHPDPAPGHPSAFAVGPFQLNSAGALASSPVASWSSQAASSWAWSSDGIDWALGRINGVAHGLTGSTAINRIVSQFEIPADIPGEQSRAQARYPYYYAKWWNVEDTTGSSPTTNPTLVSDPTQGKTVDTSATASSPGTFTLIPGVGGWPGVKISFGFLWAALLFAGGIAAIVIGLIIYFHKELGEAAQQVGRTAEVAAVAA